MQPIFNPTTPKKAANLSVNSDFLRLAKDYNINLPATFEQALSEVVKQKQRQQWLVDNRQAIDIYNDHLADLGYLRNEVAVAIDFLEAGI